MISVENKIFTILRIAFSVCAKRTGGFDWISLGTYARKLIVTALASSCVAFAYVGILFAGNDTIRSHHLYQDDGLSHRTINCIFQDSRGFMWFGTQDVLNRYDGCTITVSKSNNFCSYAVAEDGNVNSWIGDEFNAN